MRSRTRLNNPASGYNGRDDRFENRIRKINSTRGAADTEHMEMTTLVGDHQDERRARFGIPEGSVVPRRRFRVRVERGPANPRELICENERIAIGSGPDADLILHDEAVSPVHCDIAPEKDAFVLRDLGSRSGTWLAGVRVREVVLATEARFRIGSCEMLFAPVVEAKDVEVPRFARLGGLIGSSPIMRAVIERLTKVAERDTGLLLEGESGTGKELVVEGVHGASSRRDGPFVVVDCGSIPRTLIESELFGHERGAFTGAVARKRGHFEIADGGTIFLDEIGDM
jgi:hypothetical protein